MQRHASSSTSPTPASRSIRRSSRRRSPARRVMQLGFTMYGEDGVRRRPGDQRLARRLQDPEHARHARRSCRTRRSRPSRATARSAPRAWARPRRSRVSPAIANAIDDAVGVRLTALPLTAEAVYRALRASAQASRWRTSDADHPLHSQRRARSAPRSRRIITLVEVLQRAVRPVRARAKAARRASCGCCTVLVDGTRGVGLPLCWRLSSTATDGDDDRASRRRMESSRRCRRLFSNAARSSAGSARRASC